VDRTLNIARDMGPKAQPSPFAHRKMVVIRKRLDEDETLFQAKVGSRTNSHRSPAAHGIARPAASRDRNVEPELRDEDLASTSHLRDETPFPEALSVTTKSGELIGEQAPHVQSNLLHVICGFASRFQFREDVAGDIFRTSSASAPRIHAFRHWRHSAELSSDPRKTSFSVPRCPFA